MLEELSRAGQHEPYITWLLIFGEEGSRAWEWPPKSPTGRHKDSAGNKGMEVTYQPDIVFWSEKHEHGL